MVTDPTNSFTAVVLWPSSLLPWPRHFRQTDIDDALRSGLTALGLPADPALERQCARLLRLLDKWNRAFNLTAVRDPVEMVPRHLLDSLSARPFLAGTSVLDVGTGAGFPGLPLALVEPRRHFTLLDSGGKKIRFVRHVVGELALDNVVGRAGPGGSIRTRGPL